MKNQHTYFGGERGAIFSEYAIAMVLLGIMLMVSVVFLISTFSERERKSFEATKKGAPCAACVGGQPCLSEEKELCPP